MRSFLVLVFIVFSLNAAEMTIAAGAGYKKMTLELLENFESSDKIDKTFGNMRQITTQAQNHNISVLIGDKKFFDEVEFLKSKQTQKIANGKLVIIYPKGKFIKNLNDLESNDFQKIAIPDKKKAVYGRAGFETIKNANLAINDKLLEVVTVPQTASYVINGEVEAGFVNLSEALSIKDKVGGIFMVDERLYDEIEIVVLKLDSCQNKDICKEFLEYLKSDLAKEIIQKYGL